MAKEDKKDKKGKKNKKDKKNKKVDKAVESQDGVVLDLSDGKKNILPAISSMIDEAGRTAYLISGVRASYPHLYQAPVFNGQVDKKGIKIIFDNDNERDCAIRDALLDIFRGVGEEKFDDDLPDDGDWALRSKKGQWSLNAKTDSDLGVFGLDGQTRLTENSSNAEGQIYAGCYVNVKIVPWCQDNQYGQRINCQLVGVQKHSDGDPLDGKTTSAQDQMKGFGAMPSASTESASKHGL